MFTRGFAFQLMQFVCVDARTVWQDGAIELAKRRGIHLIEDAAQSLGSRYKGKHLGTFGQVGSLSFSAPKIITTGQGGALVTDDPQLADRIRKIKDFGRQKSGVDHHETMGFNFKFTDLQAVIGIAQMKKLDWRVARKKEMFALYQNELEGMKEVVGLSARLHERGECRFAGTNTRARTWRPRTSSPGTTAARRSSSGGPSRRPRADRRSPSSAR